MHFVSASVFIDEVTELFEIMTSTNQQIVPAGDINIHMDVDNVYKNRFNEVVTYLISNSI